MTPGAIRQRYQPPMIRKSERRGFSLGDTQLTTAATENEIDLAEHIVRRGQGCPSSKPYALVSKSNGRVLGCHESKESALRQEAAIKAAQHCSTGCECQKNAEHRIHISAPGKIRREVMEGRSHLVVPAVLVLSQVLHNNLGRAYLPADEITEDFASLWNGIPVLLGDHPQQLGEPISGRDPGLWEERRVGFIFNARAEQLGSDTARLVGEVWLDETRVEAVEGFKAVLDAVQAGTVVELSTGFGTKTEQSAGSFHGEAYDLIMHPVAPDHLVVSTEMTGACSVRDGCGLGAHARGNAPVEPNDKSIWERVTALFEAKPVALTQDEQRALHAKRLIEEVGNALAPTDGELLGRLRDALQEQYGSADTHCIIADTISAKNEIIFWWATPMGPYPKGGVYFMTSWTESGGKYKFAEPAEVRRMTLYEPVANAAAGQSAGNAEVAAATNSKPVKGEGEAMSDENKDLAAQVASLVTAVQGLADRFTKIETAAQQDPNPAIAGLKQQVTKLVDELAQMREVTTAAVNERERERQDLIRKLAGHYRVPFTAADLESKPLDELRKLAQMAESTNFAGRGGPQGKNGGEENRFAEPISPWTKEKKEGGE